MYGLFVVLVAVVATAATQSCHFGSHCPSTATCCRNSLGEALVDSPGFGHFGGISLTDRSGQCTSQLSREHQICDSHCHCEPGYECYTPMSGVCCPPARCYNATWVQQQKDYWQKCMADPHCALPP
ncbi:uncharacterized protein LOC128166815 isoform X1 [Crassostrea angulata]|uniref:uncharacterized protein LOC128166815 isoform X1 n=1 Tax=Magallana angulata TaxID=2784310 RepID=UPI0022B0BD18|nr:uncharacterized protein LOC128166815 isoform X1 [Crassostrea angulata]